MKEPFILAILTLWVSATRSAPSVQLYETQRNSFAVKLLSHTTGTSDSIEQCPAVDDIENIVTFPSVSDCAEFYICSEGKPLKFRCLGDLKWNTVMQACDLPENVDCVNGERPSDITTTPPATTEDPLTTTKPEPDIVCPLEIGIHTFPHPFDCTRYYMCADYTPYPRKCPDDLLFNPEIGVCDWKENMVYKCELN